MSEITDEAARRWPKPAPERRPLSQETWEHSDTRYGFEQGAAWAFEQVREFVASAVIEDTESVDDYSPSGASSLGAHDLAVAVFALLTEKREPASSAPTEEVPRG